MLQKNVILVMCRWLLIGLIIMICTQCVAAESSLSDHTSTVSGIDIVSTTTTTPILPSNTPTSTNVPPATSTSRPVSTPTQRATSTPIPSSTPMATKTLGPTLTPLPTIPVGKRGQTYNELMRNNKGCILPCWWGFELGKTSLEQVEQFYLSFDASVTKRNLANGRARLTVVFVDPQIEDGIQVRHTFHAQDNIVIEAEIEVIYSENHQIEPLLQRLKQPSEVWLRTISEPIEGVLPVSLRLYFPDQGVLVSYAVFGELINDTIQVCFNDIGGTIYLLWDSARWNPNGDKGFIERANESGELTIEGHRPIEEISNWNVEQFYTILSNPNHTECLQTTSNLWSSP